MRRVRLKSKMKFCPRLFFAISPCAAITSRKGGKPSSLKRSTPLRDVRCHADGCDHACFIGDALAGDAKCGAMIRRGAHDRKTQCDVHARPESNGLDGYERLVVVHAKDRVVGLARLLMKQRVGG